MKFTLVKDRVQDSTPNIEVTFPDGYTDRLILQKHYFNEEDKKNIDNHCNYVVRLAEEKTACVAMTGCLGRIHLIIHEFSLTANLRIFQEIEMDYLFNMFC